MDAHEVVFAEGTPAKSSLLEECGRERFANFVEYEKLYGVDDGRIMQPFAPRIEYDGIGGEFVQLFRSAVLPLVRCS
jgi:hypothetical protein